MSDFEGEKLVALHSTYECNAFTSKIYSTSYLCN